MLELEDDGVAGAGSTELPGYEDYYDGDPASRERFGPAEREETVIQAPQVMLGTRTGTPRQLLLAELGLRYGVQQPCRWFGALHSSPALGRFSSP